MSWSTSYQIFKWESFRLGTKISSNYKDHTEKKTKNNKHHSLLGHNISPFDNTDKLFLPDKKGISPQGISLLDAVFTVLKYTNFI